MAVRSRKAKKQKIGPRVLILGGGFGGVRAALDLDRLLPPEVQIQLVDKKAYHLPQWLLYEAATMHMSSTGRADFWKAREAFAVPFTQLFRDTRITFLQAEVKDLLLTEKRVTLSWGAHAEPHLGALSYDYLVLALGSETNYFGIAGMREESLPLKGLEDAFNVRNAIDELCSRKRHEENINIVIGGGGFTGVELAAEMCGYLAKLAEVYRLDRTRIRLSVVEATSCLLPGAKKWVAMRTQKRLAKLGVSIELDSPIERFAEGQLFLKGGKIMPADLLIWTAGVRANALMERTSGAALAKTCLMVDENLELPGHSGVYGVGDNVYCFDKARACPVPPTAQRAVDQGRAVAQNIAAVVVKKAQKPFVPREPFFVVPLGGKYGLADLRGVGVEGSLGWLLKMFVGLKYLLSILPLASAVTFWWRMMVVTTKND